MLQVFYVHTKPICYNETKRGDGMATRTNSIDMVNGPLWGKVLKFAALYMLTAVLQHLYSAADVIVVGRFAGQDALAGVGTCAVITKLFLNFILGLSAGATIVLGQAIGANNKGEISKAVHTSIAVAITGGLIITAICLLFTKQLLGMIDVQESVMPEAAAYLRIVSLGFVPSLLYNFGAAILRAKGDNKRALYIVTVSGIINVIMNLFFVCVLEMKASGVATATVISQLFTAIAILYVLRREKDETKLSLRKIRFDKKSFLKILKLGVPSGIQSSVYSISNMLVQSSVNSFGPAATAGAAATTSITDFYNVSLNSLYQASVVFVSQNFGAKKFDRIKKTILICVIYVTCLWAIQALITFLFGKTLLEIYAPNDPETVRMGWMKLSLMGCTYGILGYMNVASGVLRGMGKSFVNMMTAIIGVCGIRILWVMTGFRVIGTFRSLYYCYPISWIVTLILHSIMIVLVYKKQKSKQLGAVSLSVQQ